MKPTVRAPTFICGYCEQPILPPTHMTYDETRKAMIHRDRECPATLPAGTDTPARA